MLIDIEMDMMLTMQCGGSDVLVLPGDRPCESHVCMTLPGRLVWGHMFNPDWVEARRIRSLIPADMYYKMAWYRTGCYGDMLRFSTMECLHYRDYGCYHCSCSDQIVCYHTSDFKFLMRPCL